MSQVNRHYKPLGVLHLIIGVIQLIFLFIIRVFSASLVAFFNSQQSDTLELPMWLLNYGFYIAVTIGYLFLLFVVAPSIIGGVALMNGQKWGMPLVLTSGILLLPGFPLGSVLGIYTIWVFLESRKKESNVENQ